MAKIDELLANYTRQVSFPWDRKLAGPQRVWFAVYDKADERRLRARVPDFELKTKQAGHGWLLHDVTNAFARWMAGRKYRERYFASPELLASALEDFRNAVVVELRSVLTGAASGPNTVVAVQGIACLFGFLRVAELIHAVEEAIPGRLLIFFPGECQGNNYRLLEARDGWDYLGTPITPYQRASTE